MAPLFKQDILQQQLALQTIVERYALNSERLPPKSAQPVMLTAMGASFHASQIAAYHLNQLGVSARAIEAIDLLHYNDPQLRHIDQLVYISQSGASAEVVPLTERLATGTRLLGVTNTVDSPLMQRADETLLLSADLEQAPVASKTYLNTLAILWLLARKWGDAWRGDEAQMLHQVAMRCGQLVANADDIARRWLDTLNKCETLLFVGYGPHGATARQAAMMLHEWAKIPALSMSGGAFRHGSIEIVRPNLGVVVFASAGQSQAAARRLADEVTAAGARVLVVDSGESFLDGEAISADSLDEFLAPILDIIPAQLFTEAIARTRGIDTTFQYISKVVTQL